MRVGAWSLQRDANVARLVLPVEWEDSERAPEVLWFEWSAGTAELISANADAALLATYPLAMWYGERRVALEGTVCPRLADGTRAAMALAAHRRNGLTVPTLEARQATLDDGVAARPRAAALCVSGGVDALSALRENLTTTPAAHPARVRFAPYVFGLNSYDFDVDTPNPARVLASRSNAVRLAGLTEPYGVALVTVATNLRALFPSFDAWSAVAHANIAPLATVAHTMRGHIRALAMASSGKGHARDLIGHEVLHGFHSSAAVDVHVVQLMEERFTKLRRLVAWPEGLAVLRVCLLIELPDGAGINCGRCEKCVRTMLMLLLIGGGALARAPFPEDVTAEAIDRVIIDSGVARPYYAELSPALRRIGRDDLAEAIDRGLSRAERSRPPADRGGRTWWQRLTGR